MADLVSLKVFNSRMEAEIVRSLLESKGIKSTIASDDAGGMYPTLSSRGYRILVEKKNLKQASGLLYAQTD